MFKGRRKRLKESFRFRGATAQPQQSWCFPASCTLSLLEAQGEDVSHDSHEGASHITPRMAHWGCVVESRTV